MFTAGGIGFDGTTKAIYRVGRHERALASTFFKPVAREETRIDSIMLCTTLSSNAGHDIPPMIDETDFAPRLIFLLAVLRKTMTMRKLFVLRQTVVIDDDEK